MIKRFLPTETTYNHNKHVLKPLRAEVVEEANGMFELEIELPKGTQLNKRDIITAPTPRGVQPFRVYRITKTLQGIKAYARHIFYDLANALLLDVRPTNTNVNGALQSIFNAVGWSGWSYLSDITDLRTAYYIRKNPVEAIIGAENSVLNTWGGNLIRNGKEVRINASGVDRGYEIRLGKNLIGIEDDSDDSNVVTRLYPTFERNQVIYGIPEGYIDSPLVGNYPTPIAKEIRVALTDEQKELPDADIHDILRAFCNNLYSVDNVDKPVVNYKIDFVQLAKVSRMAQERKYTYAGLEQLTYETLQTLTYGELQSVNVIEQFTDLLEKVDLYDLVKIKVKELDIDLQAKVISYRYDCLGERYAKLELGGFKPSNQYQIGNLVQQIKNDRDKASEEFRELYDLAINKVTGNAGGYQITRRNANDEPYETLWMDTPDIQTAQKVLRINQNGIAGSADGFNGPYNVAITTDGWIVAERIQAINLSAISADLGTVTAGRIEDDSGVNYWDLNTGDMNLNEIKIAGKKVSVSLSEIDGDINSLELTAQGLTNRVSNAEGDIFALETTAQGLTVDVRNLDGDVANLKLGAEELKFEVSNIKIGGRNLLKNSGFEDGLQHWAKNMGHENVGDGSSYTSYEGKNILIIAQGGQNSSGVYQYFNNFKIGETYTISAMVLVENPISFGVPGSMAEAQAFGGWKLVTHTFIATSTSLPIRFLLVDGPNKRAFYLDNVKLEEGNMATSWVPASEDIESKVTTVSITVDGMKIDVQNLDGDVTNLNLRATGLENRVANAEGDIFELETTATSLQSQITASNGNISTLNQTAQGLAIAVAAADGKALNAQATADGLTIQVGKKGSEMIDQKYQNDISKPSPITNSWLVPSDFVGKSDNINRLAILGSKFCVSDYFPHVAKAEYRLSIKDAYRQNVNPSYPLMIGLEFWDDIGVSSMTNQGAIYIPSILDVSQWVGEKGVVIDTSSLSGDYHKCKYVRIRVLTYWNVGATDGYTYIEGLSLTRNGQVSTLVGNSYTFDSMAFTIKDSNGAELMSLSKGVANEQNIGRVDNVEAGYPMKIPFHIGSEVSQITQAVLKWDMSNFRTYSKGAASGGGTKTTPEGGGRTSGASSSTTTTEAYNFTGVATTAIARDSGGSHVHDMTKSTFQHSHGFSHTHYTGDHQHSVDITHEHAPVFGILETEITVDYTVGIEIDGVYRAQPSGTRGIIDLSAWITTNGWHEIILYVNGIKRLDANLFLKTYIRR